MVLNAMGLCVVAHPMKTRATLNRQVNGRQVFSCHPPLVGCWADYIPTQPDPVKPKTMGFREETRRFRGPRPAFPLIGVCGANGIGEAIARPRRPGVAAAVVTGCGRRAGARTATSKRSFWQPAWPPTDFLFFKLQGKLLFQKIQQTGRRAVYTGPG